MRHPHYDGRKAENVPSVGSRLAGVIKASYGKPKLRIEGIPVTQSVQVPGLPPLARHGLTAKSPYRLTSDTRQAIAERASLLRLQRRNAKRFQSAPRLVVPA